MILFILPILSSCLKRDRLHQRRLEHSRQRRFEHVFDPLGEDKLHFAANLVGAWIFMGGEIGVMQLVRNAADSVQSFALLPIPLFILMGEVMFHTGVAGRAIDAVDKLIARVPGRLSLVAITGGTIFSSLSGSTIANTAMLSSTLLPEMYRRGYKPSIAIGPNVAVGGIAILIPPSALAVPSGARRSDQDSSECDSGRCQWQIAAVSSA